MDDINVINFKLIPNYIHCLAKLQITIRNINYSTCKVLIEYLFKKTIVVINF